MLSTLRINLIKAAERDTAPLRRLVAWLLSRDAPMTPSERQLLIDASQAIALAEQFYEGEDEWAD